MSDIQRYRAIVLSGLLNSANSPREADNRFWYVMEKLADPHFAVDTLVVWKAACSYFMLTGATIGRRDYKDSLRAGGLGEERIIPLLALYDVLIREDNRQSEERFRYGVARLQDQTKADRLGSGMADAMEILVRGTNSRQGRLYGYEDAKHHIMSEIGAIDELALTASADGAINVEGRAIADEYEAVKISADARGVETGFQDLDALTFGAQKGELWILAGYVGHAKTLLLCNIAYHAAFRQGRNVLFGTAETLRSQVRRRLVCRHSHDPRFESPLQYRDIRHGTLSAPNEERFRAVLDDMNNPNYGRIQLFQIPRGASLAFIEHKLARYEREFGIDLLCIDYLALIATERYRRSHREELEELLKGAKQMAVTHNDGKGVPFITPWHVSREAWREATKAHNRYTMDCLSGSSEAEKSADLVWTVLRDPDDRSHLICQVLKCRDSEDRMNFDLRAQFATCYVGSESRSSLLED